MKKLLLIIGGSAALLLSILFGAFFAGPLLASASTQATTTTTAQPNAYCEQYQQDLAKRLGVSVSTLQQDRQGALADVLAQMVKDGKLTQAQANTIKQRAASHQECTGKHFAYRGFVVKQFLSKYRSDIISQVASGLHLSAAQLTSQLQAGKSLNQIAKAQNVSTANLHTIVLNAVTNDLNKAANAGDLTKTQADNFSQFLKNHPRYVDHILNRHAAKHAPKQPAQNSSQANQ